jgi:hypothetical protein
VVVCFEQPGRTISLPGCLMSQATSPRVCLSGSSIPPANSEARDSRCAGDSGAHSATAASSFATCPLVSPSNGAVVIARFLGVLHGVRDVGADASDIGNFVRLELAVFYHLPYEAAGYPVELGEFSNTVGTPDVGSDWRHARAFHSDASDHFSRWPHRAASRVSNLVAKVAISHRLCEGPRRVVGAQRCLCKSLPMVVNSSTFAAIFGVSIPLSSVHDPLRTKCGGTTSAQAFGTPVSL